MIDSERLRAVLPLTEDDLGFWSRPPTWRFNTFVVAVGLVSLFSLMEGAGLWARVAFTLLPLWLGAGTVWFVRLAFYARSGVRPTRRATWFVLPVVALAIVPVALLAPPLTFLSGRAALTTTAEALLDDAASPSSELDHRWFGLVHVQQADVWSPPDDGDAVVVFRTGYLAWRETGYLYSPNGQPPTDVALEAKYAGICGVRRLEARWFRWHCDHG